MISNMMSQLREVRLEHRLDEILEETARVRKELGYLVMVSPFSQYVMTQAVLNVLHGDRYAIIPDEIRRYVLGHYGRPAAPIDRSEEHTSELQSQSNLVCRLLLE